MGRCRDYDICGLEDDADPGGGLCILHSRMPGKDHQAFAKSLAAHRGSRGDNFTRMMFPGPVDMSAESFKTAFFNGAVFLDTCDFTGSSFDDAAFFHGAEFSGKANFTLTTFSVTSTFSRAQFRQAARFHSGSFREPADFSDTLFAKDADFAETTFSAEANFSGAAWEMGLAFRGATFAQEADFSRSTFRTPPTFRQGRFADAARFVRADLAAGADFQETTFGGAGPDFEGARFAGRTSFSAREEANLPGRCFAGVPANFRGARIEEEEGVVFYDADLRLCRFLDSDVRNIRFIRPLWPRMPGRDARAGVFDEIVPRGAGEPRPWAQLEQLYRDLRTGAEAQGEQERAGDFRYGEMEMRRRNPATPRSTRALLAAYALLAGYGERYLRPLAWAAGLWVVAAASYLALGLASVTSGTPLDASGAGDWLRALHFSLEVMTWSTPWDTVPLGYAKAVQIMQHLGGPLLVALAVHGIWRRLRR